MPAANISPLQQPFMRKGVSLSANTVLVPPVVFLGKVSTAFRVQVGKFTYLGGGTKIYGTTTVGNYCSISRNVEIAPFDHPLSYLSCHPFQYNNKYFTKWVGYDEHARVPIPKRPATSIGHDVWIGVKAFIRKGITVGTGAVIAAGTIVTKDVPPYAIVGGTPGRIIKYRFDEPLREQLLESRWWELEPQEMDGVDFTNPALAVSQIGEKRKEAVAENRKYLAGRLINGVEDSDDGTVWIVAPHGHVDRKAISGGELVAVKNLTSGYLRKNPKNMLARGKYIIVDARYNEQQRAYHMKLRLPTSNQCYAGPVEKDGLSLQRLDV